MGIIQRFFEAESGIETGRLLGEIGATIFIPIIIFVIVYYYWKSLKCDKKYLYIMWASIIPILLILFLLGISYLVIGIIWFVIFLILNVSRRIREKAEMKKKKKVDW